MRKRKKNIAFTATETVVAIAVATGIMLSIYSLYLLHQRAYRKGEEAGEVIQNGRIVLERLSRELRQAKEIVTILPDTRDSEELSPPNNIKFQDGHVPQITEEQNPQAVSENTITLYGLASETNDYYKGTFIKIISGTGEGQVKEIIEYDSASKVATVKGAWEIQPTTTSIYRIDSSFYYIYYFKDGSNNLRRQVLIYHFSDTSPTYYVPWNAVPPTGETLVEEILIDEIIGEYITSLEFWGNPLINIALTITKGDKSMDLFTKVHGRNL